MSSRQTFTRTKRYAIAFNVAVASLLALGVGGVVIYLGFRPELRQRVDLTTDRTLTLEDKTLQVLEQLPEGVEISTCFRMDPQPFNSAGQYVPGLDLVIQRIAMHAVDLVHEYEFHSGGKIRAHTYSPSLSAHFQRIEELGRKIGDRPENVVVVEYGSRIKVLRLADLAQYDDGARTSQAMRRAFLEGFRDQEAITSALLTVTQEKQPILGFLRGHGERSPMEAGLGRSGRGGMARFAAALQGDNFALQSIDLNEHSIEPGSPDVLIVAAPVEPLTAAEMDAVVRYVQDGGRLYLMLEPDSPVDLDYPWLDQLLGLRRLPGMVNISMNTGVFTRRPFAFTEVRYGATSPIVKPLRDSLLGTFWQSAVALETLGRPEHSDLRYDILAWTVPEAYLDLSEGGEYNESFDPASEKQGEYRLGYSVVFPPEEGGGRVVVLGDVDLISDVVLQSAPAGNLTLGLGVANWLAEREALISLPIRKYDEVFMELDASEYRRIFLYVVIAVPSLALLLAIVVFWSRRN